MQPILDKTSTPIDTYASLGPPMEKVLRRGLQIPQKDDRTISFMFLSFMSLCETGEKSREFMEFLVSFFFTQLQRSIDNVQVFMNTALEMFCYTYYHKRNIVLLIFAVVWRSAVFGQFFFFFCRIPGICMEWKRSSLRLLVLLICARNAGHFLILVQRL